MTITNKTIKIPYYHTINLSLFGLTFFELNTDAIERQKLNILQNSSLPIASNSEITVKSYFESIDANCHDIGYFIAEYFEHYKFK